MGLFDFMKTDVERAAEDAIKDVKTESESKGVLNEVVNDITRAANHVFESETYNKVYDAVRDVAKR